MLKRVVDKIICGVFALMLVESALAQDTDEAELKAQYEKKISQPWFKDNGFTEDFSHALAEAKRTGKPIFAYFTATYFS